MSTGYAIPLRSGAILQTWRVQWLGYDGRARAIRIRRTSAGARTFAETLSAAGARDVSVSAV